VDFPTKPTATANDVTKILKLKILRENFFPGNTNATFAVNYELKRLIIRWGNEEEKQGNVT
jgi:hypothetical protein